MHIKKKLKRLKKIILRLLFDFVAKRYIVMFNGNLQPDIFSRLNIEILEIYNIIDGVLCRGLLADIEQLKTYPFIVDISSDEPISIVPDFDMGTSTEDANKQWYYNRIGMNNSQFHGSGSTKVASNINCICIRYWCKSV